MLPTVGAVLLEGGIARHLHWEFSLGLRLPFIFACIYKGLSFERLSFRMLIDVD